MTKVIGLTGGIAAGKSTVSDYLKRKGIPVIDADLVARQVVAPGTVGLAQIACEFGEQYLMPDGTLNRALLGQKVFSDSTALVKLNAITDPLIFDELKRQLQIQSAPLVVLDAALLLENSIWYELVDVIWVVSVTPETQLKRLIARNGYTVRQAKERIASQMSDEERRNLADIVIDNNGSVTHTYAQVELRLKQEEWELWD